jgi:peptidoglycan hydrolase CwlO-like protein
MWTSIKTVFSKPRTWVLLGLAAVIIWVFYLYHDRREAKDQLGQVKSEQVQTKADLKATQQKQVEINNALDVAQNQVEILQNTSDQIQKEVKEVPHDSKPISAPVAKSLERLCRFDNPPCR